VRRSIYVAATRARSLLVVVGSAKAAAEIDLDELAAALRCGDGPSGERP
jgi:ATP-dependent exoDNAse (exonuclease V) alpha subunit